MGTHRRSYRSAYDVAIVGGGHNGLVAGAYLARAGLSVLIVEQRDKVGGLCATEEVIPGYKANLAANSAHNLDPRIIYDLKLREHGLQFRFVEPSSFTLFDSGKKLIGWSDKHQLTESIGRFSRADMKGHFEALNALSTFGELLDVSFFAPAPRMSELVARLRTPAEERAFASIAFGSATDFVSDYLESSELRASMTLVAVTGTMMGPSTPGSAYGLAHRALYRGSTAVKRRHLASELDTESSTAPFSKGTPLGGMGAVARALERSFLALGGEIEVGVSVAEIRYENGLATGIVLESGDEIEARFVVSNANPKTTLLQLLPPDALSDEQRGPLEAADMKGCMSKVIIALDRKPQFAPENAHENELLQTAGFRLCPSIAQMDRDAERARAGQWYEEPVVFGLLQSAVDPTLAPEGRHLLSLSVGGSPYQLADGTWASRRDDWAKHVIAAVDRFVPGLASTVVDYHCVTPLDLERDFGLTNGHLTHGDLTSDLLLRWGPIPGFGGAATPIGGLYLCSVGVWPANFVSGIPGENAARAILAVLSEANRVRRKPERLDISDVTDIGVS